MNKITIIEVIQNVGVFKEIGKIKHLLKFSYDFQLSLKKLEVKPQTEKTHKIPGKDIQKYVFDDSVLTIYLRNGS